MDSVVHSFAFVYSFSLCVPPEIKDPEGRNEPQPARRTSSQREFAAVQPSGNLQIQIHAIKDRYHNAKSVTIPLPTRVRQTIGALLSDREPGRNICFCEYIISR